MPGKIRLALAGVGNCASALLQGLAWYAQKTDADVGLTQRVLGGYDVCDITPVLAFDVSAQKVGRDLAEAIMAPPNCAWQVPDVRVAPTGVEVLSGPVGDGMPAHLAKYAAVDRCAAGGHCAGAARLRRGSPAQHAAHRLDGGGAPLCTGGAGSGRGLHQRHAGAHRLRRFLCARGAGAQGAGGRRRCEEPAGRHHPAPRHGGGDAGARHPHPPHLSAQLRPATRTSTTSCTVAKARSKPSARPSRRSSPTRPESRPLSRTCR